MTIHLPLFTPQDQHSQGWLRPALPSLGVPGREEVTFHPSSPPTKPRRSTLPLHWGSCASQAFPQAPRAQKAAAKRHGLAVIIPGRRSVRASSIPGICLCRSQQWPHRRQRCSSADRHSRAKTPVAPPWFIRQGQAIGWKLCLAILYRGSGVTRVKPLALPALVPAYCSPFFPPWQVFGLLIAQMQSTGGGGGVLIKTLATAGASANPTGLAFQGSAAHLSDTSS